MLMPKLRRLLLVCGLWIAVVLPLSAQLDPQGAEVMSYFPELADGGPPSQKWATSLSFVNPHSTLSASATAFFYSDDGSPLALDFGNGPETIHRFTVPPLGSVTFKSSAGSINTQVGWASVVSTLPLQGVVQFSFSTNGVPQEAISTQATAAAQVFRSPATPTTGIAIANPSSSVQSTPVTVTVTVYDASGTSLGQTLVTVPPSGHRQFTLSDRFSSLPARESVVLSAQTPGQNFVAWMLSGDGGVFSSYPAAGQSRPAAQYERITKIFQKLANAGQSLQFFSSALPTLTIDNRTDQANLFATVSGNQVTVFTGLAELVSDSDSALAFLIGHALGHLAFATKGTFVSGDLETNADAYGDSMVLAAGYDPYAASAALGELIMAAGPVGILSPSYDGLGDPRASFNTRLPAIYSAVQAACGQAALQSMCSQYKSAGHAHLPPGPVY